MSERDAYPPGVPCWVDILAGDPARAMDFYGRLFGWEFTGPGPGEYYEARLRGRHVAGVGRHVAGVGAAPQGAAAWNTYVSVASVEDSVQVAVRAGARVLAGSFDALPAGRIAVLEDPTGAPICLWEPVQRLGCQLVNEPSAYAMSVLQTHEQEAAARFYHAVFGWEAEPFAPGMTLLRLPGYVGGEPAQPVPRDVVAVMATNGEQPRWDVGFWVHDADALTAAVVELGGRVLAPPSDAGAMRQAVLADPFGAPFSVTTAPGR
ncbi:MAG: VOC family protein [Solirubrobacterales bacterium]|nr:VOC family protein [Solirubrobacterales bacterium]